MGEKRVFAKEFKERAVELALKADRKQSEIAAGLVIDGNTLSRWKREAREAEGEPSRRFPGKGRQGMTSLPGSNGRMRTFGKRTRF
jgi:transposase-like protein